MLYFERWKIFSIICVILVGLIGILPNFLTSDTFRASWPRWLPGGQLQLGLDLQGGAYLLYEVDRSLYQQQRLTSLIKTVGTALQTSPQIGYSGLRIDQGDITVRIRDQAQIAQAQDRLNKVLRPESSGFLGGEVPEFSLQMLSSQGDFKISLTEEGIDQRLSDAVAQSIEIVRRRIDELGVAETSIQRQGLDRILVESPGLDDPKRLKDIVGQTAQMTFHLVRDIVPSTPPPPSPFGTRVFPDANEAEAGVAYVVESVPLLAGSDLVTARAGFDSLTNQPVVNFRFNTAGAQKFARITQENVGRPFAIILDNKVLTAPQIQEPIIGGSGQISGNFTTAQANDLAVLLRAGALPVKLNVIEERSVGPSLGSDSISAGKTATLVSFLLVVIFMSLYYRVFGIFSSVSLLVNLILIFSALSILGATLTLPGIAGIVLTIGMAVDANVLVYERIREDYRAGMSPIKAIDSGFQQSLSSIMDANITTFIVALILFLLGSGPVRGFAVTLAIGIITSLFSSFTFNRLLIAYWVHRQRRLSTLPI